MSDPGPGPLVVRPRVLSRVCWGIAAAIVVLFAVVAVALGNGPPGPNRFRVPDQLAFVALGVLIALGPLSFTRARVVADGSGVRVRNLVGERHVPWQVVRAVLLTEGTPWATLDLHDDDTISLLAVQSGDGESTVDAVLALRRLLADSRRPGPTDASGGSGGP
ncbi:MAG: hypothetical protein JWN88_2684 [Frankiales bacterium]|nr:hypothetical protein [Frankiales bacterium]